MACRKLKNLENPTFSDVDNFSHCRVMVLVHGPTWAIMGRDCWAMGRFSQVAACNGGFGDVAVGQRAGSRRTWPATAGFGAQPSDNGTVLAGYGFRSWGLGHGCRAADRFSRGAAPDGHVRGCGRRAMGQFSQVAPPEIGSLLVSGTVLAGYGPRRQDLGKLGQSMHAFRGAS